MLVFTLTGGPSTLLLSAQFHILSNYRFELDKRLPLWEEEWAGFGDESVIRKLAHAKFMRLFLCFHPNISCLWLVCFGILYCPRSAFAASFVLSCFCLVDSSLESGSWGGSLFSHSLYSCRGALAPRALLKGDLCFRILKFYLVFLIDRRSAWVVCNANQLDAVSGHRRLCKSLDAASLWPLNERIHWKVSSESCVVPAVRRLYLDSLQLL